MARIRKDSQEHVHLADSVERWGRLRGVSNDPYLSSLVADLRERKNLTMWATLNPMEYLPQPTMDAGGRSAMWTRRLTIIRNVLVFLPVALTWYAVGQATTAFSKYVAANGTDVVNFLDFWQNGYNILAKEWTISNVATLDFLIIILVIALTLFVSLQGRKSSELQDRAERELEGERVKVSMEIVGYLHDKRALSNVTLNATLTNAINKLLNATHSIESTTKALEKSTKKFPIAKAADDFTYDFSVGGTASPARSTKRSSRGK
jgi:hypothetical protein